MSRLGKLFKLGEDALEAGARMFRREGRQAGHSARETSQHADDAAREAREAQTRTAAARRADDAEQRFNQRLEQHRVRQAVENPNPRHEGLLDAQGRPIRRADASEVSGSARSTTSQPVSPQMTAGGNFVSQIFHALGNSPKFIKWPVLAGAAAYFGFVNIPGAGTNDDGGIWGTMQRGAGSYNMPVPDFIKNGRFYIEGQAVRQESFAKLNQNSAQVAASEREQGLAEADQRALDLGSQAIVSGLTGAPADVPANTGPALQLSDAFDKVMMAMPNVSDEQLSSIQQAFIAAGGQDGLSANEQSKFETELDSRFDRNTVSQIKNSLGM